MDISDRDSQKRLIKTFVNAIYLYDDHFDIAFNYTENGKVIVKMQEIDDASTGGAFGCCAQCPTINHQNEHTTFITMIGNVFVLFCPFPGLK